MKSQGFTSGDGMEKIREELAKGAIHYKPALPKAKPPEQVKIGFRPKRR